MKMIDDSGMQTSGQHAFVQWVYKIRFALTALFFIILPWQTRWIYRASPIHSDAEWGRLSLHASEVVFGVLLVWALLLVILRAEGPKDPVRTMVTTMPRDSSGRRTSALRMTIFSVLAILLYGAIRSWFSGDPAAGFQHTWWLLEAVLVVVFLRTGWFPWRAAVAGLFVGLSLAALLSIYQVASQYAPGNKWLGLAEHRPEWGGSSVIENADGRFLRAYGPFPHPNILGGYMVLGLMVFGFRVLSYIRASMLKRMTIVILFNSSVVVMLSAALALSFSRSAWIAWVVVLAVALIARKRAAVPYGALSVLTMAVVLITLWPITITRFDRTARLEARSFEERTISIADGLAAWKQTLWFGVGPVQYMNTFSVQHPDTPWWQLAPPHNAAVALLVEYGIFGTFLVSVTILLFLWSLKNARAILWLLPLVVLTMFDHYLWSLYSGVMLVAVYVGFYAQLIHTIPTMSTQRPLDSFCSS